MVEWIERPLLILKVRSSNPGHFISKNITSLPSLRSRAQPWISELSEWGGAIPKKMFALTQKLCLKYESVSVLLNFKYASIGLKFIQQDVRGTLQSMVAGCLQTYQR